MTKVIEAIYADGLLHPLNALDLPDQQRVRLIVQTVDGASSPDRTAAMERLRAGVASMNFHLLGPLPTRDELHDRV
jgi:predicted DNA-binding antitoxin AbrB/MazE fold protein